MRGELEISDEQSYNLRVERRTNEKWFLMHIQNFSSYKLISVLVTLQLTKYFKKTPLLNLVNKEHY